MKNLYLSLLSFACLNCVDLAHAADTPATFNHEQVAEIKKIAEEYIVKNPTVVMAAFQAGMAEQQKAELEKVEKAVSEHKDKIFKNANAPTAGNPNGTQSLVAFMDPYCGYCKKFYGELATILKDNKDVKITFVDIPIMGDGSTLAIKAMLAAAAQGKYEQMQKAVYTADKHLTKRQILKIADLIGLDKKKFDDALKGKELDVQVEHNAELAKTLGIHGTPTLIFGEGKVMPGFIPAEKANEILKETASAGTGSGSGGAEGTSTGGSGTGNNSKTE